jgi:heat shock protein HslJ
MLLGLAGCGPQPPMDLMREVEGLDDVPWVLETLRGQNLIPQLRMPHEEMDEDTDGREQPPPPGDTPRPVTLEFKQQDGGWSISGFSGCNTYHASCTIDGAAFTAGPVAATRKFCPADTIEQRYLQVLAQASELRLKRNALFLVDSDTVLATFIPDFR